MYNLYNKKEDFNRLKNIIKELLKKDIINTDLITNELLEFIIDKHDNMNSILDKVEVLLKPKEKEKQNLYEYLYYMQNILIINSTSNYFFFQMEPYKYIDKNNITLRLYNLMSLLKYFNNNNQLYDSLNDLGIIDIIISYLYANDINDYTILYNFINDPDYYYQKLILSGIQIKEYDVNVFDKLPYIEIYNNIENLFKANKDKKYIK